jgi:UDP-N-acetylmuramoylalanine--D-glutamate ligase
VIVWDDSAEAIAKAEARGLQAADLRLADWSAFSALVLSPGVPLTHPAPHWSVVLAQKAGVEVIGDIELFCRERARLAPDAPFVAITGTNGKSTTTALLAHLLRHAGKDVAMGGNIGTPILDLPPPVAGRTHVIEMSSYQIDLTPSLQPSVGILLNITPDHIDRHGTLEHYAGVKERLVKAADKVVIGVDDPFTEAAAVRLDHTGKPIVRISLQETLGAGIHVRGREIFAWRGHGRKLADLTGIASLRGDHNAQNAAAALAACLALGIDESVLQAGLASFPGLAHRMEPVGRVGKAWLVNDSKATNADSTEKALLSFPEGLFWIAGGKPKEGGIAGLAPLFPRVAMAYLIGAAEAEFAATLEGKVPYRRCGTLEHAIAAAADDANASKFSDPVILLSPSCASFDQFPNFEVRGDHFRALARQLTGFSER